MTLLATAATRVPLVFAAVSLLAAGPASAAETVRAPIVFS